MINNNPKEDKNTTNSSNNDVQYATFDIEEPPKNIKTKEQFLQYKRMQELKDEEILEEMKGRAKQIKEGQLLIKDELRKQEPLLSQIDKDMDKLDSKITKQNNVLAKYLEKSSDSCLYWIIGIELVLLFLFFMI